MKNPTREILRVIRSTPDHRTDEIKKRIECILDEYRSAIENEMRQNLIRLELPSPELRIYEQTQSLVWASEAAQEETIRSIRRQVYQSVLEGTPRCASRARSRNDQENFILPSWTPIQTRTGFAEKFVQHQLAREAANGNTGQVPLALRAALATRPLEVNVAATGLLGAIAREADSLSKRWRCDSADAANFILTGDAPALPVAAARMDSPPGGPARLLLRLDPRLKQDEVKTIYGDLIATIQPGKRTTRPREASLSHLKLYEQERSTMGAEFRMTALDYPKRLVTGRDVSDYRQSLLSPVNDSILRQFEQTRHRHRRDALMFVSALEATAARLLRDEGFSYPEATRLSIDNIEGKGIWSYFNGLRESPSVTELPPRVDPRMLQFTSVQVLMGCLGIGPALSLLSLALTNGTTALGAVQLGLHEDCSEVSQAFDRIRSETYVGDQSSA